MQSVYCALSEDFGPPSSDQTGPMSYQEMQNLFTAAYPAGQQNYWKSNFLNDLSYDAVDAMIHGLECVPSAACAIFVEQLSGAVRRIGRDQTAFTHRDSRFNLLVSGIWPDATDNEKHIEWARTSWQAMQPFSDDGVYVNYLGQEADEGFWTGSRQHMDRRNMSDWPA